MLKVKQLVTVPSALTAHCVHSEHFKKSATNPSMRRRSSRWSRDALIAPNAPPTARVQPVLKYCRRYTLVVASQSVAR